MLMVDAFMADFRQDDLSSDELIFDVKQDEA